MELVNLLDHPVTIQEFKGQEVKDMITYPASKSVKPKVDYKTIKVEHPLGDMQGGDKFPVRVKFLPKIRENVIYIVNAFILEALVSIDQKNALHYVSVGPQHRGTDGKVLYAKGLYIKGTQNG